MKDLTKENNTPILKAKRLVELQAQMKAIKPEIDTLKAELLAEMLNLDVLTLKTGSYTLSRAKRVTPKVVDYEALKSSLEEADIEVITEEKFAPQMDIVFKQAIEEGREFEGLESQITEYVSVRVKEQE